MNFNYFSFVIDTNNIKEHCTVTKHLHNQAEVVELEEAESKDLVLNGKLDIFVLSSIKIVALIAFSASS